MGLTVIREKAVPGIQGAFNDAIAQMKGYRNALYMTAQARDRNGRELPDTLTDPQDRFNLAFAWHEGFDTVDDFMAARGMVGRKGIDA